MNSAAGSRAICADRTDSPGGLGVGASVVALSPAEKNSRFSDSRDFFFSIALRQSRAARKVFRFTIPASRRSVFDEWGPFLVNPLLHRWATPLVSGVGD